MGFSGSAPRKPNLDSWEKFVKWNGMNPPVVTDGGSWDVKDFPLGIEHPTWAQAWHSNQFLWLTSFSGLMWHTPNTRSELTIAPYKIMMYDSGFLLARLFLLILCLFGFWGLGLFWFFFNTAEGFFYYTSFSIWLVGAQSEFVGDDNLLTEQHFLICN